LFAVMATPDRWFASVLQNRPPFRFLKKPRPAPSAVCRASLLWGFPAVQFHLFGLVVCVLRIALFHVAFVASALGYIDAWAIPGKSSPGNPGVSPASAILNIASSSF
jgi:hypothetical protein